MLSLYLIIMTYYIIAFTFLSHYELLSHNFDFKHIIWKDMILAIHIKQAFVSKSWSVLWAFRTFYHPVHCAAIDFM